MLCYFSYCARTSLLAQNSAQSASASASASTALPGSIRFAFFRKFYYTQGGHAGGRNANANGDGDSDVDDAANALTRFACVRWPKSFYIRPELNIVIKFMLLCYRYRYKIYSCTTAKALFANLSTGSALPRLDSPRLDWMSFNGNRECSNYRFQCRV